MRKGKEVRGNYDTVLIFKISNKFCRIHIIIFGGDFDFDTEDATIIVDQSCEIAKRRA